LNWSMATIRIVFIMPIGGKVRRDPSQRIPF
jgi:hypothetical protein